LELSASKFAKLPFPLAPLVEQKKIVTKIEELFINLEYIENDLQDTLKKLEMYRYSLLNELFNQKSKNRKIIKIKDLGIILTGGTPSKNNPEFYGFEYNFYKPSDLTAYGKIDESKDKLSYLGYTSIRHVPKNSILVSCIGTIGKIGLLKTEGAFNQQLNAIVPNDKYLPEFVFYQAISLNFQNLLKNNTSATTISIINKSKFSQLDFISYDIEEQKKIVQEIEYKFSIIDNLKLTTETSLEKIKLTRGKILDDAFKGKLIPQIATSENSKALLKKIQKEKISYIEQQKYLEKDKAKKRKTMDNKLSILELLNKIDKPIFVNELWEKSIHRDNIEEFYSELKSLEKNIVIENVNKNSFIRIKNENQ
jgi:type I restriction enzyme S subunit